MGIFCIDVGYGTRDILYYENEKKMENCTSCILPSRSRLVEAQLSAALEVGRIPVFFAAIIFNSDTDIYDHRSERVSLMTMHAAKGLEFPVVFLTGCERGLIPFYKSDKGMCDVEEERRLFYVALTRAMSMVNLTYSTSRFRWGNLTYCEPSRFI